MSEAAEIERLHVALAQQMEANRKWMHRYQATRRKLRKLRMGGPGTFEVEVWIVEDGAYENRGVWPIAYWSRNDAKAAVEVEDARRASARGVSVANGTASGFRTKTPPPIEWKDGDDFSYSTNRDWDDGAHITRLAFEDEVGGEQSTMNKEEQ